jgi:UDP-glucuronate decarboxylase
MSSKRVLVTGGAGFIGSHLCRRLLEEGNAVVCLDSFVTGARANIADLEGRDGFTLFVGDVIDPMSVDVDQIFNLACPASPVHYQADPIRTLKTCTLGVLNLIDLALRLNIPLLQASTSEVYGDPLVHPQVEEYWGSVNPIGIRSCYDEGKRCAEALLFSAWRQTGLQIKVVRIFNTYGPNMQVNDGRVVSNMVVQALGGTDITIFGDGSQTRSFCYVSDLVDGLIRMMDSDPGITGPINLGNPDEFTIAELAAKVVDSTRSTSRIVHCELPDDDPRKRRPSIEKARAVLGWTPRVPLAEGLLHTIAYFREVVQQPRD